MAEPDSAAKVRADRFGQPRFGRLRVGLRTLGPLLALVLFIVAFAAADRLMGRGGHFLTLRNAQAIASQTTTTIVVAALGMTIVIIAGGIDLSAGTAISLCATVLALALMSSRLQPYNPHAAIVVTLAVGGLCGLLNGALVSFLRIVPFIVTLGTMSLYLGVAKILAKETVVRPDKTTQVPSWLIQLTALRKEALRFGFPRGVWIALALSIVTATLLRYTVFGRRVFAIGSNELAARLCGINVRAMKMAVYSLAGLCFGLAGIYQFSLLCEGEPTSGAGMELKIIAAVVIGGASLNGGRGSILGTLAGAAVMAVIESGCTQLGLTNPVQDVMYGIVIVTAVAIDQLRQRRSGLA